MASLNICFGDEVKLKDSRTGRVRYIGPTLIKKDAIFYGIHLKDQSGDNDGKDIDNRQCFKCPSKHGIFVEKSKIIKIIKRHTISASFFYNECVQMVNSKNTRKGRIKYVGLTHFGSNIWYGIELESKKIKMDKSYLDKNEQNIYFAADRNKSIFVRANQIKSIALNKHRMHIIEDEEDESVIDENMLRMMNNLNIPPNARTDMLAMEKAKKILLIKQWFLTKPNSANHKRRSSAPTSPIPAVSKSKKKKKKSVQSFDDSSSKSIKSECNKRRRKKKKTKSMKQEMNSKGTVLALSQTSNLGPFAESDSEDMPFDGCIVTEKKTKLRMKRSQSVNDNKSFEKKEKPKSKKKKKARTKSKPNIVKSEKKNMKNKRPKMEKSKSYNVGKTNKTNKKNEKHVQHKKKKKKEKSETSLKISKPTKKETEEMDLKVQSKENRTPRLKKYSKSLSLLIKRKMDHSQHDEEYYF